MKASIPASRIASVTPSVISAGGTGLDLSGLILSESNKVPVGTVQSFGDADAVGAFFGLGSIEYALAVKYFAGFDNSSIKPAALLFAQYANVAVPAYVRGGSLAGMTLATLHTLTGTITIEIDGVDYTTAAIDLSAVGSFSAAAAAIQAALVTAGATDATCTYDSALHAFTIASGTTGTASTILPATANATATGLKLTAAAGAIVSAGSDAMTPASAMALVIAQTEDWATFTTAFLPSTDDMVAFAAWNATIPNRFVYVLWDNNVALTSTDDSTTGLGRIRAASYPAVFPIFEPVDGAQKAAAVMGMVASIDFTRTNGRVNLALRSQAGLLPGVTSAPIADQLELNGCNFYGAYATAADQFVFFYPGVVTGEFGYADTLVNQIWMTNEFQLALMELLTSVTSIPYNDAGYALIESALNDPILAALNFGAIQPGVTLSALQRAEVNAAAGANVADTISLRGWYLQVQPASPQVRAARGSPPINFWYTDGGSVQRIALNSAEVQ